MRGSLTIWFDSGMHRDVARTGRRGRQPVHGGEEDRKSLWGTVFPTNAVQNCVLLKVLFGMIDIEEPLVRATMSTRQIERTA